MEYKVSISLHVSFLSADATFCQADAPLPQNTPMPKTVWKH